MNQILSFKTSENGQKIIKNNIKHLCIFLILFALAMVGNGAWRLYTNLNKKVDVVKPVIVGHTQSGKTVFNVKSAVGIKKIVYTWNNGVENVVKKSGEKDFSFEVNNPIGVNELNIKSYGVDGSVVIYDSIKVVYDDDDGMGEVQENDTPTTIEDWEKAIENDSNPPTIALTADTGKVVITASDDIRMSYVTYSWNGGDEVKVTGLSEDEKTLSAKIDVLKGDNKLKVKAYDKAGNIKEIDKPVHGTSGADIVVQRRDDTLHVSVTDEYGITKIEYNFNNEEKTISNIEGTVYEFDLDLVDGENFIIVNAYEGAVKTEYSGRTTK